MVLAVVWTLLVASVAFAEYERVRGAAPQEALRTHLAAYNRWWADNVPYIDVPDQNVRKMWPGTASTRTAARPRPTRRVAGAMPP